MCSKASVMLPFLFNPALLKTVCAPSKSLVLSAAITALSPQHIFTSWCRPLIDLASPVSRKRHTSWPCFPLQWQAVQSKTWTWRLSTYSMWGVCQKNMLYMGEIQSFARQSGYQVSSSMEYCSVCVTPLSYSVLRSYYVTHLSPPYPICTTGPLHLVYRTNLGLCHYLNA